VSTIRTRVSDIRRRLHQLRPTLTPRNPAFLTMFGYSSEELQQLSFLDICVDEAGDECRIPLRELREGVRLHYEIETQHRRKDGTSLPVNTYFSAVSERGPNQRTFLTVTVDISARRAAEGALRAAQSRAGEGRASNYGGRDGSDNRTRTQPAVSSDCIER
jgi:PAS domain S-box-containing protein